MVRSILNRLILIVTVLTVSLSVFAEKPKDTNVVNTPDVNVVNTPDVNVTNSSLNVVGTVDVTGSNISVENFPETQQVSGSVKITNDGVEPLYVADVSNDREPFVYSCLVQLKTGGAVNVTDYCIDYDSNLYPKPKEVVIENINYSLTSSSSSQFPQRVRAALIIPRIKIGSSASGKAWIHLPKDSTKVTWSNYLSDNLSTSIRFPYSPVSTNAVVEIEISEGGATISYDSWFRVTLTGYVQY